MQYRLLSVCAAVLGAFLPRVAAQSECNRTSLQLSTDDYVAAHEKGSVSDLVNIAEDRVVNGPKSIVDEWPSLRAVGFTMIDAVLPHPRSQPASHFVPNRNTLAADEIQAHTGMFDAKTNDGYYELGLASAQLIRVAVTQLATAGQPPPVPPKQAEEVKAAMHSSDSAQVAEAAHVNSGSATKGAAVAAAVGGAGAVAAVAAAVAEEPAVPQSPDQVASQEDDDEESDEGDDDDDFPWFW